MKKVSYAAFENYILPAHPNASVEVRDGAEVVVIPTWDFNTDAQGEYVYLLDRGSEEAKFKPGDELTHTETGAKFNVVDPLAAMMSLRKGPNVKDSE